MLGLGFGSRSSGFRFLDWISDCNAQEREMQSVWDAASVVNLPSKKIYSMKVHTCNCTCTVDVETKV